MQIFVERGKNKSMLVGLAHNFAEQLKLDNSRYTLNIVPYNGFFKKTKAYASTLAEEKVIGLWIDPELDTRIIASAMAHEMVHVKQFAKGTLKYNPEDCETVWWRGYPVNLSCVEYIDRPWEIEAYSKQEILVRRLPK